MINKTNYILDVRNIVKAYNILKEVIICTPFQKNLFLSDKYKANVFLKREDLQFVRSYKIRGAYNKIISLSSIQLKNGIICASAGNHAQGVAYSCNKLKIFGKIFMPVTTPRQKVTRVKMLGKNYVDVFLSGDTFDSSYNKALLEKKKNNYTLIHPFDDPKIIEGQGTVGLEILNQSISFIDYLFLPIGGGGLAAGVGSYFKSFSPKTKVIGIEPKGAPSMSKSLQLGYVVCLNKIDRFVDGASVKKVGDFTFDICKNVIDEVKAIPEGKVCSTILELYNIDAIVAEPAGALSISALDFYSNKIKGKNVVCVLSGGNNDITRTEEIRERSLLYEGLKHYFIVRFPQRAGALKYFVTNVLGKNDDISYFQYSKKNSKEEGPAVLGIELSNKKDLSILMKRMRKNSIPFQYINENPDLFRTLI